MGAWEKTNEFVLHNHVYYHIWRRKEGDIYYYNFSVDPTQPPSATWGGYYSIEGLISSKFGK